MYKFIISASLILFSFTCAQNDSLIADKEADKWPQNFPGDGHNYSDIFPWQKKEYDNKRWNESDDIGKEVVIKISGGKVRGYVSHIAGENKPAHVFKGVPFAEPPVDELRFKPLQKKKHWKGTWNATKYRAACLSNTTHTRSPQHYISEDCIYVNIFADPKCMEGTKKCPVLFYIHGGGFAYDSATMFNDTQIVEKYASDGIVFLIPAYRLGIFGFLDLGSDWPVKRNLGLHDIIFALEWAHQEVHNFGGDPKRITIMGNSAGASAATYLCASPAVREDLFQQAIISSGVPFFTPDANLQQSLAIIDRFECLRDPKSNRSYSDLAKVECLRSVGPMDLLRAQQFLETKGIDISGPETDTELLPAKDYIELLRSWKGRPLLYSTTKNEFGWRWGKETNNLHTECIKGLVVFGYHTQAAYNACFAKYNDTFNLEPNMRVSYESMHAESFLTGLVNTRMGGLSYIGEFELANYSNHADDLSLEYFFFGLHYIPLNTTDVILMDSYYPIMIKKFLQGHSPDRDWKPQNWNGRNYFRITFNVSTNGSIIEGPHGVDGYQDVAGLDFWLRELAIIERNARKNETLQKWKNSAEDEEKIWEDVFGKGRKKEGRKYKFRLPVFTALNANPQMTENANPQTMESYDASDELFSSTDSIQQEELRHVWSAFWLSLTVIVLLTVAIGLLAVTKLLHRFQNARGYSYNWAAGNGRGYFTEKTRIVDANPNNGMRYG